MAKKLVVSNDYSPIFNRIILMCDEKKTTVSALMDVYATSRSAIGAWKKGNISAETIANIADELDVSLDYLIRGRDRVPENQPSSIQQIDGREQELLRNFRLLPDNEKDQLIGRVQLMAEQVTEIKRIV